MAAPANYYVKTGTYKSTAFTGIKSFSIDEDGSPTDVATDGSATITMTFLNNIGYTVSVETTDASVVQGANFRVGSAGSLVLVMQKRAEGKGPVGAADKTATFANAVVVSNGQGIPHEGESTTRIVWRCSDPNGSTAVVYS